MAVREADNMVSLNGRINADQNKRKTLFELKVVKRLCIMRIDS